MSQLKLTKELAISITASLPIGVCLVSNDGEVVYSNPKAEDIFGFSKGELLGRSVEDLMPENKRKPHIKMRENYMISPESIGMSNGRILPGLKKNGEEIELQIGLTPLADKLTLISLIESTNEIIKLSNSNDPLTGLPNRSLFTEYSENLRRLAKRNNKSFSIIFMDLDNFKSVNDFFGHDVGDLVICELARLLRDDIRENDIIARVGGDEFVICLYSVEKITNLEKISNNLISKIRSIGYIGENPIDIGASIGAVITFSPDSFLTTEMVGMADKLMYKAKKMGKGRAIVSEV